MLCTLVKRMAYNFPDWPERMFCPTQPKHSRCAQPIGALDERPASSNGRPYKIEHLFYLNLGFCWRDSSRRMLLYFLLRSDQPLSLGIARVDYHILVNNGSSTLVLY